MQTPDTTAPSSMPWSKLSPLACVAVIVVLAALAAWPFLGAVRSGASGKIDLFGSALSRPEQCRIRMTLLRLEASGFEFVHDRLLVPAGSEAKYLKLIAEANVMPRLFSLAQSTAPAANNPFLSRLEQQRMQLDRREKELQQLLLGFPFVEDAPSVRIDVRDTGGMYESPDIRCVVSIQPQGQLVLGPSEIATLHRNILSSVAGLEAGQILINDLNSGIAWDQTTLQQDPAGENAAMIGQLRQQRQLEHQIRLALADWPGVQFEVTPTVPSSPMLQTSNFAGPPEVGMKAADREAPAIASSVPKPETNVPARVPAVLPQTAESTGSALPVSHSPRTATVSPRLEIRLQIDEEGLRHFALQQKGASQNPDLQTDGVEQAVDTPQIRRQAEAAMLARLQPALRLNEAGPLAIEPLQIDFAESHSLPVSAGGLGLKMFNGRINGSAVAVGSGLLLCLLLFVSMRRRSVLPDGANSEEEPATVPSTKPVKRRPDVWLDNSADTAGREQLRKQIDELIENNPDAAARVIKSWIRDAA